MKFIWFATFSKISDTVKNISRWDLYFLCQMLMPNLAKIESLENKIRHFHLSNSIYVCWVQGRGVGIHSYRLENIFILWCLQIDNFFSITSSQIVRIRANKIWFRIEKLFCWNMCCKHFKLILNWPWFHQRRN